MPAANSISFVCDYCGGPGSARRSDYIKKKRHFCKWECYTLWRKNVAGPEDNNAWKGGITPASTAKWRDKNRARVNAAARARRLRELNAPGSHTKADWEAIKTRHHNQCAMKDETCGGAITKDHITPLIRGGSNDPDNLQPLCRSHNVRKNRKIYLGLDTTIE